MIKLSIIIVNWNAGEVLKDCLESIYNTINVPFEVIVVDNDSSDSSVYTIKKKFAGVILIEEKENVGFSKGNNIGFKHSKGDYILILNPDVVLLENAVDRMVKFLETHSEVGILGPKILDKYKNISSSSKGRLPTPWQDFLSLFLIDKIVHWVMIRLSKVPFLKKILYGYYERTEECERLSGSCLLLKREVFEFLNGFDENLPMYLDDVDLCYRSRKVGKKNFYLADAEIVHIGQYSTKKARDYKAYDIISMQARVLYYRKYFGKINILLYKSIVLISMPYLLILDILSFPHFLFTKRLKEKISVIKKHIRYFEILLEK